MIKNIEIINRATAHFEGLKQDASYKNLSIEAAFEENSEYSTAKYALKSVLFDLQKAEFFKNNEEIEQLSRQKSTLEKQLKVLREKLSIAAPKSVSCALCGDTGIYNGKYCKCYYDKITELCYSAIGVAYPRLISFSDDTLSEELNRHEMFEKLKHYANDFSKDSMNLLFTGEPGTGKSFLSEAIATQISANRHIVIYLTANDFNKVALKIHLAKTYEKQELLDILTSCDFLVIDDLGIENIYENVTREYLLSIISERLHANEPFLITTNLSFDKLNERYGERLFSRLSGSNVAKIGFSGADLRRVRK